MDVAHLLVASQPDRIVERSLLARLLDAVHSLVEQIELVCEVLQESHFVVERAEGDLVLVHTCNRVDEIFRRLLLKA